MLLAGHARGLSACMLVALLEGLLLSRVTPIHLLYVCVRVGVATVGSERGWVSVVMPLA